MFLGQGQVYEESSQLLTRLCKVNLSGKQIENLCHHYGEKLEELVEEQVISTKKESDLHYVMVDGSYIMSRENGWTEAKVGRVFKQEDNFAISEKRAIIKESTYVAHIGNHLDFCEKLSPILDPLSNMVFIADGATWFWKWIATYYPNSIQILDFFHSYEKICQWATITLKDKLLCSEWCESCKNLLLNNQVDEVIIQVQETDCNGESKEKKEALLTYLNNNRRRMQYKTYLGLGYLIGSGAIEAAQRSVIQHRMKRSGQRWTLKGGQQLLNIRTARMSNRWDKIVNLVKMVA